jgi:hypothetical protein
LTWNLTSGTVLEFAPHPILCSVSERGICGRIPKFAPQLLIMIAKMFITVEMNLDLLIDKGPSVEMNEGTPRRCFDGNLLSTSPVDCHYLSHVPAESPNFYTMPSAPESPKFHDVSWATKIPKVPTVEMNEGAPHRCY